MNFVWTKDLSETKNTNLLFAADIDADGTRELSGGISCGGYYKLYLNGKFVQFGAAHTAKGYLREDRFRFPLIAGKNRVCVLISDCCVANYSTVKQEPFFYWHATDGTRDYSADCFAAYHFTPRMQVIQRYSFQRGFAESYEMPADLSEILARPDDFLPRVTLTERAPLTVLPRNIPVPVLQTVSNDRALQSGTFRFCPEKPVWNYRSLDAVGNKFEGFYRKDLPECLSDYVSRLEYQTGEKPHADLSAGEYTVYDLGRDVSGFAGMTLSVEEDADVLFLYDERIDPYGRVNCLRFSCTNVVKWKLPAGNYSVETLEPYTMKRVQILVRKGKITVGQVFVRLAENAEAYHLKFTSNDPDLSRIVRAAECTLAQNSVDLLSDCPSRERAAYMNDIYFTRKSAYLLAGNRVVERNTLENFLLCGQSPDLPEGMVPMCYPAEHINGMFIPNCAMWYAIIACEYCRDEKDDEFAKHLQKQLYGILNYFKRFENEYGLLEDLESWIFVEWSRANSPEFVKGVNFPTNMIYRRMLSAIGELYGDTELLQKSAALKDRITRLSYNGEFFEDNCVRENGQLVRKGHISEVCQYHAFALGLASRETYPALYEKLKTEFTPDRDLQTVYPEIDKANIINGLLLRETLLLDNGEWEQALRETKKIFLCMAEETGTLWEKVAPSNSCNHGVASYAAYLIVRACTGLKGLEVGKPVLDDCFSPLDCGLTLPTAAGTVEIRVKNGKRTVQIR